MLNEEQTRLKNKLIKQVQRYEEKGYTDTAAHSVLASLLKTESAGGVPAKNTKKVKQEQANGEQDL